MIIINNNTRIQEENEDVVEAVLKAHPHFELQYCLPTWKSRGLPVFLGGMFFDFVRYT